jgi:hypothetical protein
MFTVVEPLAVLGVAYLSYLLAELFHFSGIIRYVLNNNVQTVHCFLYYECFQAVKLITGTQSSQQWCSPLKPDIDVNST